MNTITFGRLGQFHPTTVMACISLLYVVLWFGIPLILFDQPAFFLDGCCARADVGSGLADFSAAASSFVPLVVIYVS